MALRLVPRLTRSALALTARGQVRHESHQVTLSPEMRDRYYPKLGNRDIVGFGWNGEAGYMDRPEFPCPPVRFKENSAEVMALREKEKGDWHKLTLEEKKALYRASFCQTYAEIYAPTGEWKRVVGIVLFALSFSCAVVIYLKTFVVGEMPHTLSQEWQEKELANMIRQRVNRVDGIASNFDYENNRWK